MTKFALVFIFIISFFAYVFDIGGPFNQLIASTFYLLAPLVAIILGIKTVKIYGFKNQHGQAILFISLGILSWFVGEIIWELFDKVLGIDPFPSIADIFYLLGYPLLLSGLIKEVKQTKLKLKDQKTLLFFTSFIALLLVTIVGYFGVYYAFDPELSLIENLVSVSYGVGDMILIIASLFVVKLAFDYQGGKLFKSWIFIFIGLMTTLAADILFAIYLTPYEEGLKPFIYLDLVWILSYLLLAYGFFSIYQSLSIFTKRISS
jgi:hypothetical protein